MRTKRFAALTIPFTFLFLGCDDSSSPTGLTPSSVTQISLLPLKVGDKWTVNVSDADIKGGTETLSITKEDSAYNGVPVYIGEITMTAPPFTSDGSAFSNYAETGRTFLRKSDQQVVYRFESIDADLIPAGSSVLRKIHIEAETRIEPTGDIPTTLTPGLAWTIQEVTTIGRMIFDDGELVEQSDSTKTETLSYTTKGIYNITVPAGTFPAIEIDHVVAETGKTVVEFFSEEAKVTVKETDTEVGEPPAVFELRALSLVK